MPTITSKPISPEDLIAAAEVTAPVRVRSDRQQRLNAQQQAAVEYGQPCTKAGFRSDPLLIIAGAGTGKTNTLAHRTAHLVLNGVDPGRILLMTFSRRAAQELANRAKLILAQEADARGIADTALDISWMGTFHSVANRLLRQYARSIGLEPDFTIMDRGDAGDMIDLLRHQLGYSSTGKRFPKKSTCVDIYSRCVNAQAPLEHILKQHFPWCADWHDELKTLFRAYATTKLEQVCLDYDDLLLFWFHMVSEPAVAETIRARFDHVLVDEYQDTNLLQAGILQRLFPTGGGLTVVGDDAQSIYSFRSANVENILQFPTLFDPPARVIPLSMNYRSTQGILDVSNVLLSESRSGYKNVLYSHHCEQEPGPDTDKDVNACEKPLLVSVEDEEQQAKYIVEQVLLAREEGIALKRQAILFRSSHHTDRLEVELRRVDIPYVKHGGLRFLEAAHVKDALAVLRWADNPKHRLSGFRVLKLLPGVGPKSAEKILDYLELHNFSFSALGSFQSGHLPQQEWLQLLQLLLDVHHNALPWAEQMPAVAGWYRNILEENYDNPFVRGGDIDQLAQIAQQFSCRERFLSELTLDPPSSTGDLSKHPHKDDDFLILSTIHSAKGQEWRNVFVINVADGNFPNEYAVDKPDELEEERRLLNVAITRAQRQLHLIQPLKYWVPEQQRLGGKHVYGAKSRFLTRAVVETLQPESYPIRQLTEADRLAGELALTDIKAKVMGMWDD
ncbi:MAG: ATP-dependent helicase [Halioglobus sp.]